VRVVQVVRVESETQKPTHKSVSDRNGYIIFARCSHVVSHVCYRIISACVYVFVLSRTLLISIGAADSERKYLSTRSTFSRVRVHIRKRARAREDQSYLFLFVSLRVSYSKRRTTLDNYPSKIRNSRMRTCFKLYRGCVAQPRVTSHFKQ